MNSLGLLLLFIVPQFLLFSFFLLRFEDHNVVEVIYECANASQNEDHIERLHWSTHLAHIKERNVDGVTTLFRCCFFVKLVIDIFDLRKHDLFCIRKLDIRKFFRVR